MKLGEKIRYLREVEGSLRGLGRPMTQLELVRAIREESGKGAEGRKAVHQPVLSLADRKRSAPAYDAVLARAAGQVF